MTALRITRRAGRWSAAGLFIVLLTAGCSSGSHQVGSVDAGDADLGSAAAAPESDPGSRAADSTPGTTSGSTPGSTPGAARPAVSTQAIIRTGNVTLESADVGATRDGAIAAIAGLGGIVGDEETSAKNGGEVSRSLLTFRVPTAKFDAAMKALGEQGTLLSSGRTSTDVTDQVTDTAVRIRAQEASLRRIEALLAKTTTLGQIVSVEAELTRRQADLDALKANQTRLANETSMSTITVLLTLASKTEAQPAPEKRETGFLVGLSGGWKVLSKMGTAVATASGALLPFAGVSLLVLGPIGWWLRRRRRVLPTVPRGAL